MVEIMILIGYKHAQTPDVVLLMCIATCHEILYPGQLAIWAPWAPYRLQAKLKLKIQDSLT